MKPISTGFLAACILCAAAGGCAGYLSDRAKDASEILELAGGWSSGLALNARATKLAQAGLGAYSGDWAGLREGRLAVWKEERAEVGVTPFHYHEIFRAGGGALIDIRHPLPWDPGYETYLNDLFLLTDRGFFEVGLTANVVLVGVDASIEVAEAVDFVAGWLGADILQDDAYAVPPEKHVSRLASRSAWKRYAAARALRRLSGRSFGYVLYTVPDEHPEDQLRARLLWKEWLEEQAVE